MELVKGEIKNNRLFGTLNKITMPLWYILINLWIGDFMTFGENIKNLRIKNNLTQKELAEKLNLSRPTIGRYESDERFPDRETIIDLAELFDVSIDEMFGRENYINKKVFKEEEKFFKVNKIDKILCKKEIDEEYLNDEEFLEDIIEFGYKAAIKIKLYKEINKK